MADERPPIWVQLITGLMPLLTDFGCRAEYAALGNAVMTLP
ncbi:hypothetical protein N692_04785 [Lactiplantibacillus plantarum EGD-AQ4]|nr:hypothetical protein N692_04785 [Lactiplantibacillus plantarum EGD-AQ4]